jgi:hypothetical protein
MKASLHWEAIFLLTLDDGTFNKNLHKKSKASLHTVGGYNIM